MKGGGTKTDDLVHSYINNRSRWWSATKTTALSHVR